MLEARRASRCSSAAAFATSRPIEGWLGKGITRVIIGTAAVRDPALVKDAAKKFPGRVAVGLDARDGKVAVEGWAETSQVTVLEIAQRFEDAGVAAIIFTGHRARRFAEGSQSGRHDCAGRSDLDSGDRLGRAGLDRRYRRACCEPRANKLAGAIAGRALYDGRLDAAAAMAKIRAARTAGATA